MSQADEPRKLVPLEPDKQPLPPALKAWLDNVIVPALVKQWLAEVPEYHGVNSEQSRTAQNPKR